MAKVAKRRVTVFKQIKFECSERFYQLVMEQRAERHLTLLELGSRAFERYLAVPEYLHRAIDEIVGSSRGTVKLEKFLREMFELRVQQAREVLANKAILLDREQMKKSVEQVEIWTLAREIGECAAELPIEKVRLLRESILLDLKYYRSARIKASSVSGSKTK